VFRAIIKDIAKGCLKAISDMDTEETFPQFKYPEYDYFNYKPLECNYSTLESFVSWHAYFLEVALKQVALGDYAQSVKNITIAQLIQNEIRKYYNNFGPKDKRSRADNI
jgi:hypothetical protein